MKRTKYLEGTFKDYAGVERKYTIAAVTIDSEAVPLEPDNVFEMARILADESYQYKDDSCILCDLEKASRGHMETCRAVYFGYSICNPKDTYSQEMGKSIAERRALNPRSRIGEIGVSHNMLLSQQYIEMCMKRFGETLEKDPAQYSPTYASAEKKYRKKNMRIAAPVKTQE
jgi:hypothetical protein